jgi:hypothetical protein
MSIDTLDRGLLYYLATPYSHADAWLREVRFQAAARIAGMLYLEHGLRTFCPIAHSHPVAMELNPQRVHPHWHAKREAPDPCDAKFWLGWDEVLNHSCKGLIIGMLPGWSDSKGISMEIPWFEETGLPVKMLDPKKWFTDAEWRMLEAWKEGGA